MWTSLVTFSAPKSIHSKQRYRAISRDVQKSGVKCPSYFIRAPAIKKVGENVEILAKYYLSEEKKKEMGMDIESVVVAVKQKNLLA